MTAIEQDEYADIRDAVAKLCAQFPGEYWRKLDREMAYPKAFVDALTESGYLSVLIPEEFGGAGKTLRCHGFIGPARSSPIFTVQVCFTPECGPAATRSL